MIGLIAQQLGLGLVIGLLIGAAASWALERLPADAAQFAPVATVAAVAIGFGLADVAGGSGFLSVYIVGLWVGNAATPLPPLPRHLPRRPCVPGSGRPVHRARAARLSAASCGDVVLPGLAVGAVLVFVARPVAVWLSTLFQGFDARERTLLGWAGLRGAVPIVLATYAQADGLPEARTIFNAVFFVGARLLGRPGADPGAPGPPTRADRARPRFPEPPLEVAAVSSLGSGLLELACPPDSAVAGRHVRELGLPRDSLVAVDRPPRGGGATARLDGGRGGRRPLRALPAGEQARHRASSTAPAEGLDVRVRRQASPHPRSRRAGLRPPGIRRVAGQ